VAAQKNNIVKRGTSWQIRVRANGQTIRKSFKTKFAAEQALNRLKVERDQCRQQNDWSGLHAFITPKSARTFADAASDYMAERANYKTSTIASYHSILNSYLLPAFGAVLLTDITDSEIKKFQAALTVSPRRINTIMSLGCSILEQEHRQGAIARNPSASLRRAQEPKASIDPLSGEELQAVLEAVEAHYRPLFITLAYTGARPNEITALRWSDIDWHKEEISITKGRVRGVEGLPKTRSAERKIPMLPQVVAALKEVKTRPLTSATGYIFTTKKGQPLNKHLDRIWRRAEIRAGLRHRPSYQLRHTMATQLITKHFPSNYVARLLGHSTVEPVLRNYAGWVDSATAEQDELLKRSFVVSANPGASHSKSH
jgi:integrase